MNYILDTNVLLRLIEKNHPQYPEAFGALSKLEGDGSTIFILIQNASEFWNVCTRPKENNGLGLTTDQTDRQLKTFEDLYEILFDTAEVYKNWREIVVNYKVSGVKVHDARIAAAMKAHGIGNLLTFNTEDFKRYNWINGVDPKNL